MNASIQEKNQIKEANSILENGELTIKVASSHYQESPMSDEQKRKVREDAPSLYKIFEETLQSKNEYNLEAIRWNEEDEVEMDYLSQPALHSFILEAEKLGKKVSYEKVLKVKISD